jgi:acetyl-CoA carboxylase biotin carboxyl carrier protein
MSETPTVPAPPDPESHDVRTIRQLVRLMQRYDLTAIDLGEGSRKIRLRRRGAEAAPAAPAAAPAAAAYHAPAPSPAAATAPAAPPPAPAAPQGSFLRSPMVGTFYSASTPDAPPFVQAGTVVRADTTVCIIEAMKVFTDIPAGLSGTIVEVLVKNGQPVEFDQPLYRIEPA